MKNSIRMTVKQLLKMLLQNILLPLVYGFWRLIYHGKEPELILFADAHHDCLPFSMAHIRDTLVSRGYSVQEEIYNFAHMSPLTSTWISVKFMRLYAKAKVIFICDTFLPVASCKKFPGTKVVQLWHACGLLKQMGYDTPEDVPSYYRGSVYRNYDLVTVSSQACVVPCARAMHLSTDVVRPLGVSRTDVYFDESWKEECRREFEARYPQARGKTVVLWAPTFRGNAGDPYQVGVEEIRALEQQLGEEYFLLRKVHPHVDNKLGLSDTDIPAERLLCVTDLLITDYSTVLMDYFFFDKPYVLFAPDLAEYGRKRGLYVDYEELSPYVVTEAAALYPTVLEALERGMPQGWVQKQREFHDACCDGHATERILEVIGL